MHDYIRNLAQRFGGSQALATFVGVSTETLKSWRMGRRQPTGEAMRLLQVLGMLAIDAPFVFDSLVRPDKAPTLRCAPIVLPSLQPLPTRQQLAPNDRPVPRMSPVTPGMTVAAMDALYPDEAPAAAPSFVPLLYGRTRAAWAAEWGNDDSTAMAGLDDDRFEEVKAFIGK